MLVRCPTASNVAYGYIARPPSVGPGRASSARSGSASAEGGSRRLNVKVRAPQYVKVGFGFGAQILIGVPGVEQILEPSVKISGDIKG